MDRNYSRFPRWAIASYAVVALLVSACAGGAESPEADDAAAETDESPGEIETESSEEPIRLGALMPISGPGAQIGESAQLGVELAVDEINEAGGVGGRLIELTIGDTEADPTSGVSEARRMIEREDVHIVVGPTYSQVTLAVQPILNSAGVASINVSGTEELTPDTAQYSFSFLVNATSQAEMMVDFAVDELSASSVAILADIGDQAISAVASMESELARRGVDVLGVQDFEYGATDLSPQILDLRSGDPDVLLLFSSTGDDTGHFLRSRDEVGWDIPVVGSYGAALSGPALSIAGDDAYRDVVGINYAGFTYCEGEDEAEDISAFMESARDFNERVAERSPYNYVAVWYDAVYLLASAIEATGSTDGPTLTEWIEENSSAFDGLNGSLSASAENHFLIGPDNLAIVHPDRERTGGIQERADC